MLLLMWILNLVISIFNAWGCGKAWVYTKERGGIAHFLNWMGAIMSACGFTWCYLIPIVFGCQWAGWIEPTYATAALELGYVVIVPAMLGSGLVITIDSWAHFVRRPGLMNGGIAAYNTFAQVRNTMNAINTLPRAISNLRGVLGGGSDGDDNKSKAVFLVIFLVAISLIAGVLTTRWIILSTSKNTFLPKG